MNRAAYFITATDTEVGKTSVTLVLMQVMQNRGKVVTGMKPVASGCEETRDGLRSEDALRIIKQSSNSEDYRVINPYAFAPAIPPHIAAQYSNRKIDINKIATRLKILKAKSDIVFVEGVGGWCVPLGPKLMLADLVKHLDLPVILIVGLRLGCINHALSTVRAISEDGAELLGWISNHIDPDYTSGRETIAILQQYINAPLLGDLPYMSNFSVSVAADHIAIA